VWRAPLKPVVLALSLAASLVAGSCGDGEAPTQPERLPNAAALIPAAPAPQPTPTPTPGAVTDDEPVPAIPGGDVAGSCAEMRNVPCSSNRPATGVPT
jgi:hypothetical protein